MTQTYGAVLDVFEPMLEDGGFDVEAYVRERLCIEIEQMGAVPDQTSLDWTEFAETHERPMRWWQRLLLRRPDEVEVRGRRYRMTGVAL